GPRLRGIDHRHPPGDNRLPHLPASLRARPDGRRGQRIIMPELLPAKASFRPDEPIEIEIRGNLPAGTLRVWHLGQLVSETPYAGGPSLTLPAFPEGGYGIELGDLRTAVEIAADPRQRLRYGFVASYAPDK